MDSDGQLLAKVTSTKDFFGSVFLRDTLDDWNLAKDMGKFLIRILPDSEIMGHALLARAYRHLGNRDLALDEVKQCRARAANRKLEPWEVETILPVLIEEERLLSGESGPEQGKKG